MTTELKTIDIVPLSPSDVVAQCVDQYAIMVDFVKRVMQPEIDYGTIPGTKRPTLLKPGAEKLCRLFSLQPRFELVTSVVDWTGVEHDLNFPLFHYHYSCTLYHKGESIAQGQGSCNSFEKKYRFNKDGSPNSRIYDQVNTICKMAQKRALVASVLIACGASEFFTQDIEDWTDVVEGKSKTDPVEDKSKLVAKVRKQIKALGWNMTQAQAFSQQHYGVTASDAMNAEQLQDLACKLDKLLKHQ